MTGADLCTKPEHGGWAGRGACVLVAAYFGSATSYALIHFHDFGSALPQFIRYVAVPISISAAFLAIALFARERWSTPSGVYAVSVLAALFLFEGYLTQQRLDVVFGMLGQLSLEQHKRFVQDQDLHRGFTLGRINRFSEVDTLSEMVLAVPPRSEIILCSGKGGLITYTADRYGYNNPDEVYSRPVDVLLLGDSFMEGFCLPRGKDLASKLRDLGLNTVTTGIRGNGPLTELAILGRMGPVFRPKHVIMGFFEGNDWENFDRELTHPWLTPALQNGAYFGSEATARTSMQRAKVALKKIDRNVVTVEDLLKHTEALRNFAALQMTGAALGLTLPKVPHERPEFRQVLRRAKALTQQWGATFSLLYIPRVDRYTGVISIDAAFDQLFLLVQRAAAAEGVEIIDLRAALQEHPAPARAYAPDAHFSEEGAEFGARVIRDHLFDIGEHAAILSDQAAQ